jgi:integrase
MDAFLASLATLRTRKAYATGLNVLADWVQVRRRGGYTEEDAWPLEIDRLTNGDVVDFAHWLQQARSLTTANTYMAGVLRYIAYLVEMEEPPARMDAAKLQATLKNRRRRVRIDPAATAVSLDSERIEAIPAIVRYHRERPIPPRSAKDHYNRRLIALRDRAFVYMLYATAARLFEILGLRRRDALIKRGDAWTLNGRINIRGKGNKSRFLIIPPEVFDEVETAVIAYVRERTDKGGYLFVSHSRRSHGQQLSKPSANQIIKEAVRALELPDSLSPHDFRHYQAARLLRQGKRLEVVQEYLGHKDPSTTRRIYAPILGADVVEKELETGFGDVESL